MAESVILNPDQEADVLPAADARLDDLAQIIASYNQVTENLQRSHERLQDEVVRLRQELTSANAQIQRSRRLSALGEMAAGIAHEIRNPLAAIQLYVGMVIDDLDTDQPQTQLALGSTRKIRSAVHGMSAIVNDVLSFARELAPQRRSVAVSEMFDFAIAAHAPAIEAADITVVRRDLLDDAVQVSVDVGLIQQALLNLVRNAVDAMAAADGGRVLTLDLERDEAGCVLVVRDTGSGIDSDCIDRIFNPFFTTRSTGTGLGLAIVHRIIDSHGGTVSVVNDGGAVFRLGMPDFAAEREIQ